MLKRSLIYCWIPLLTLLALAAPPEGNRYALLIGVNDYEHVNLPPLSCAANDVEELAQLLQSSSSGFTSVRVLTDRRGKARAADAPTAANIRRELQHLLRGRKRQDVILLALAGHGVELKVNDPQGKQPPRRYPYFCPVDGDPADEVSYSTGRCPSLLLLNDLFEQLQASGAGAKLVLIDACRKKVQAPTVTRSYSVESVTVPPGAAVLYSCASGQYALESKTLGKGHGLFFFYVLEGLRGKARNGEGVVTWGSLDEYVRRQVRRQAPQLFGEGVEQHPHGVMNLVGDSPVLMKALVAKGEARPTAQEAVVKVLGREHVVQLGKEVSLKLVRIPSTRDTFPTKGTFLMGSPNNEKGRFPYEGPQHEVELSEFYLGVFEVTQGQFRAVMGYNPSYFGMRASGRDGVRYEGSQPGGGMGRILHDNTENYPVENISHDEAVEFCKKLTELQAGKLPGWSFRLPTEAEWEYACRGPGAYRVFHCGNSLSSRQANFNGNYPYGGAEKSDNLGRTTQVGQYGNPNGFGLHDMHGNVWECCSDWYDKNSYENLLRRDPKGPPNGFYRVIRGGSWSSSAVNCRSAWRFGTAPEDRKSEQGFRVALSPSTVSRAK